MDVCQFNFNLISNIIIKCHTEVCWINLCNTVVANDEITCQIQDVVITMTSMAAEQHKMMTVMTKELHVVTDRLEVLSDRQDILSRVQDNLNTNKYLNVGVKSRDPDRGPSWPWRTSRVVHGRHSKAIPGISNGGRGLPPGPFPGVCRYDISLSITKTRCVIWQIGQITAGHYNLHARCPSPKQIPCPRLHTRALQKGENLLLSTVAR